MSTAGYETVETDVLVLGAGGAGLRGAIAAAEAGARALIVCKSLLGKAHTVMAEGGVAAALHNVAYQDTWEVHFADTIKGGKFINDWRMAELHAKESPERVLELEADIEPFRGILLGLFFVAVGLSLDLSVILENWLVILIAVPVIILIKGAMVYAASRVFGSTHSDATRLALLLPQGGEFAFVLFSVAVAAGLFTQDISSMLVAIVTLTMALTGPVIGVVSGVILGLFAWIASKLVRRGQ